MQTKLQQRSAEIKSQPVTYCLLSNKHDSNKLNPVYSFMAIMYQHCMNSVHLYETVCKPTKAERQCCFSGYNCRHICLNRQKAMTFNVMYYFSSQYN